MEDSEELVDGSASTNEGGETWTNWSGNLSSSPDRIVRPEAEAEVQTLVEECHERDETLRVVGSSHSWSPVAKTDDVLVSLEEMSGVVDHDRDTQTATILGGTTLEEAGEQLHNRNLALPNLGDVSKQTVAGAFGTGTHGTGAEFANLADILVGGRIVTGTGEVTEFDARNDPELLRAARVSLGTLGVFTELKLDVQPTYKIHRREYCTSFEEFWPQYGMLVEENRNFDFYWYPRSDEVKLRLLNGPGGGTDEADLEYAEKVEDDTGWWHLTIPAHNDIGREFEEMEYALAREDGPECFLEVRDRVRDRWRSDVGWRLLCRTVAVDDTFLSPDYERETMTIGILQNAQLEYGNYFQDIESIFREYNGRPHWGKRHTLRADELQDIYSEWDRFKEIRREMDPAGVFLTDYLRDLLGVESDDVSDETDDVGRDDDDIENNEGVPRDD